MIIPSMPGGAPANTLSKAVNQDLHDLAFLHFHHVEMLFFPHAWANAPAIKCTWKKEKFPPKDRGKIPKLPGVYVFVVETEIFDFPSAKGLLYVGKGTSLYDRIGDYIGNENKELLDSTRPLVWRMLNLWSGHLTYYYTTTIDVKAAEDLEIEMINALRPPFNTRYDATTSKPMRAF